MLKNIKSEYFIKILFMHLNNYRQLKLIKYNKYLQNQLNIHLYNYKIFKGIYTKYYEDGKIAEYYHKGDLEFVQFEGEYSNGEKNGKGREYYYKGNTLFEGEYLHGKKKWERKRILYNWLFEI